MIPIDKVRKLEKDTSISPTDDVDFKMKRISADVGKKIASARVLMKMTQQQLAQKLCINVKDLKQIEYGNSLKSGHGKTLEKICQYLKIKVSQVKNDIPKKKK